MAGPHRSAWPALFSPPGSGPSTAAASAPLTDKRAGPAGTGRGPQRGAGCPERLSPAPPTQRPFPPIPRLPWHDPARHRRARPSVKARKLFPGPRSCPRSSPRAPEQAAERSAARGPRRAKAPAAAHPGKCSPDCAQQEGGALRRGRGARGLGTR